MGARGYPPEFRRKVLDLIEAGRSIAEVAHDLGISEQSIYSWRRQDRVDRGLVPGLSSVEKAELIAAKKRIAELETELAISRRAMELLRVSSEPKRRFSAVAVMAAEKLPVQVACRVVGVSESGYYEWRGRAPSERAIGHAWLTDLIRDVHAESRGTYGGRRVHAELTLGRGVVGHGAVAMLMRQAGIVGVVGRRRTARRSGRGYGLLLARPARATGTVSWRAAGGSDLAVVGLSPCGLHSGSVAAS